MTANEGSAAAATWDFWGGTTQSTDPRAASESTRAAGFPAAAPAGSAAPPPAGSEATEDGGQRYAEDMSASEMSDKYPAGRVAVSIQNLDEDAALPRSTRSKKFDVRVADSELSAMDRRARSLGMKRSAWARETLLDALDSRRDRIGSIEVAGSMQSPSPELAKAVEQLRRVGVNLNQVVRQKLPVDEPMLAAVIAEVTALRAELGDRTAL